MTLLLTDFSMLVPKGKFRFDMEKKIFLSAHIHSAEHTFWTSHISLFWALQTKGLIISLISGLILFQKITHNAEILRMA